MRTKLQSLGDMVVCGASRHWVMTGPRFVQFALQDFAIPQDTPNNRAEVAAIVSAFETAKEYAAKEVELRAESSWPT